MFAHALAHLIKSQAFFPVAFLLVKRGLKHKGHLYDSQISEAEAPRFLSLWFGVWYVEIQQREVVGLGRREVCATVLPEHDRLDHVVSRTFQFPLSRFSVGYTF